MADKAPVFLLVTILFLVTIILVFAMKYVATTRQASLRIASEDGYRALADRTVKAQETGAEMLRAVNNALAQIEARLAKVEKVLQEVE
jgi:ribosome-associated translation inhibitor RaiA